MATQLSDSHGNPVIPEVAPPSSIAANKVTVSPISGLSSTNAQGMFQELNRKIDQGGGGGGGTPVFDRSGIVIGDSHAVRREQWIPYIYQRMGYNYNASVNAYVVGSGNDPGAGYEDYVCPVLAQAVRAVEKYKAGEQIDCIILDNVHFVDNADPINVVPVKYKHLIDLGVQQGNVSQEGNWFANNFNANIGSLTPQLGTVVKSSWQVPVHSFVFSGNPVAGTTFTLTINGTDYPTPVESGDTLATFVARVGTWVFDESNWRTQVSGTTMTLTYIGSGQAPTLTISYNAGGSGVTMTHSESTQTEVVCRYFASRSTSDWNTIAKWVKVLTWSQAALMGAIELLKEEIPSAEIVVVLIPCYPITSDMFNTDMGKDVKAFFESSFYANNRKRATTLQKIAELYQLKCIDIENLWSVSLHNWSEFTPNGDVHPYPKGYQRIAEVVCRELCV